MLYFKGNLLLKNDPQYYGKLALLKINQLCKTIESLGSTGANETFGISGEKSKQDIRSGSGNQGNVLSLSDVNGGFAVYVSSDTTSTDDNSTVIVTSDLKRYYIVTFQQLLTGPII